MKAIRTLALVLGIVGATSAVGWAQDEGISVGSVAPSVTVKDLDGHPINFGDLVGKKPMFIEFWATWCPICESLLPRVQAAHARFGDRIAFIGVNVAVNQTPERVKRYLTQHRAPFQVVYDADGVSTRAYNAPQTSYIVIVDRAGKVIYTGVGVEQKFEEALARVAGPEPAER
ncbi:MAG: TlpA disulfide reductase family protein [Gemmatimonadota bacterium]